MSLANAAVGAAGCCACLLLGACDGQDDGRITLDFWAMGREGEVVRELTAEFERLHPGITVRVQQIPWSAAHEKLLTAYAGDVMPDVFQLGNTWVPEFVALDAVRFWNSLWLTVVYTGSTVVLQVLIGLSLALLVLQIPKGQGVLRVAAILPIVLAPVVVGLFWRTLVLAPDFGLVDVASRALGMGSHNWLGDPQLALISVIAIHTWQWTPFAFLVLLATLATLPPDVYEAARLDRAGAWQRFFHITLPLIRPAIVMVVILRMMTALSAFAAIFATTGGGPGSATEILNLYAYRTSFTELNLGYGASLAVVLMAMTLAISFLMFRLRRAR